MSTFHEANPSQEHRWHKSSWLALSFTLFLLFYNVVLVWRILQVAGDGWVWIGDNLPTAPEVHFLNQLLGPPSPLQSNDNLISIQGESVAELYEKMFVWNLAPPPLWPDGTVLEYIVEREGQPITLAVPVFRYTFGDLLAASIRFGGLPALVQLAGSVFFFVVGAIVFLLRPGERAAQALLILGTAFLFNAAPTYQWTTAFFYPFRPASIPVDTWTLAINPSLMLLALAFPASKLPIRRFPRLTILFLYLSATLALNTFYLLNLGNPAGYYNTSAVVYVAQILLLFIIVFGSLIHSSFSVREPAERNQLKWVGLGLASFVLPGVGGWLLGFMGFQSDIIYLISAAGWFIMPICLAIAITRYRLFDIDIIIRKTLVYAVLSALLALVYFGLVILLQSTFDILSGQQSPIAIVISTLVIAALFAPLRRRVQNFIDRRFFRQKYDAQLVLAHFAQTARDETNMDLLITELTRVVQETMQPKAIRVWLKPGMNRQNLLNSGRNGNELKSFGRIRTDE